MTLFKWDATAVHALAETIKNVMCKFEGVRVCVRLCTFYVCVYVYGRLRKFSAHFKWNGMKWTLNQLKPLILLFPIYGFRSHLYSYLPTPCVPFIFANRFSFLTKSSSRPSSSFPPPPRVCNFPLKFQKLPSTTSIRIFIVTHFFQSVQYFNLLLFL